MATAAPVMAGKPQPAPHPSTLVDVVVATSSSLAFLEGWRAVLQPFHLIVIRTSGNAQLTVPAGFDAEVHTAADAQKRLGEQAWCVSSGDKLCRSYGYIVSKKPYVFTFEENCSVAKDPSGKSIDALKQHLFNLTQPCTPFFFNTLYDPYREGADFVRGYPFSLREGAPTAVSHGLWLNRPDYDTATSLVKPREKNTRYVDAVLTVPLGSLYPMSNINLAFNRELIGPAMYTGLSSNDQSVDDMWAGWCAKVICDHLGYGHKSGLPYVWNADRPSGQVMGNMQRDSKALMWQEEVVPFFSQVRLSLESNTAELAYLELARKVLQQFGAKDEYFVRLADAMVGWIQCWKTAAS